MSVSNEKQKSRFSSIKLNVPNDLLEKCTLKAKELGLTRTSFIIIAINEYLKQQDSINSIPSLIEELKRLQADTKV